MSDDLPYPVWSGSFMLGDVEMKCHTLSDGQRIIEAESVEKFFASLQGGVTIDHDAMEPFVKWQRGQK